MSKHTAFFVVALLLLVSLTQATRAGPSIPMENQEFKSETTSEGCEGAGEEDCLMRRTLVAHTDYIYTQGKHN